MKKIIRKIFDKKAPPVLIAEISANHTGSIKKAKKLILTAKKMAQIWLSFRLMNQGT